MNIFKFVLEETFKQVLTLPIGTYIISVKVQKGKIVLYAIVDPEWATTKDFEIIMHCTGETVRNIEDYTFVDTLLLLNDSLVYHVFYKPVR